MADNITFFDIILAEALTAGLVRVQVEEPPDNFFQLPKDVVTWKKIEAACKRENMVVCLEVTNDTSHECLEIQEMYVDLAREFDDIIFLRVVIEPNSTYDELRANVGGVEYMPTIMVLFYDVKNILCTKIQGCEEITHSFYSGNIKRKIIEYSESRRQLKMMETLVHHLISPLSRQEQLLRNAYEESFQSKLKQQEAKIREEEKKRKIEEKLEDERRKKIEEEERRKQEEKKAQEDFKKNRPKYVQELLELDLEKASVQQLKELMKKLRISSDGCAEKTDLKEALIKSVPELHIKTNTAIKKRKSSNCCKGFWLVILVTAVVVVVLGVSIGETENIMNKLHPHPRIIAQEGKRKLFMELKTIGSWETLCNHLGVSEASMQIFRYDTIEGIIKKERCLSAYVDSGKATWDHVVEVVCSYPFENKLVGKKIAIKFGVPLEVCTKT